MTEREALKLAMELLESAHVATDLVWKRHDAVEAIKEALAQPEQEPVAFVKGCNRGQWEIFPAKAYQIFEREQPLYTTPPQRTWVGLTDEEVNNFVQAVWPREATATDYIRAIEAKLKEKNI